MKFKLYIFTITILLLRKTAFTSSQKTSILESTKSVLKNLAFFAKQNQETTCSDDIEEILYYLKIGHEDIERSDVKDIFIVIGPSGVGKSTLTQFVANETNQLRAECDEWGDECWIIDDSGTVGDDLVSKTFLPNLVFHESNQTPFYDMPGFNDNRNESMEIANSFFMQQILMEAESVKILVLARYSSFEASARLDFPNLLVNLVDFIKSPAKFRGAMAIVSTMAPFHSTHDSIVRRNTRFLQETLLDDIGEIFKGREEYIRGSTEILENWLESDTGSSFDAKYFSYFLTVRQPGFLLEDILLFNNKIFLEDVVWNRMNFMPIDDNDFGLPISGAALRKLESTGACISNSLTVQMQKFSQELESYTLTSVLNLIDGKDVDIVDISKLLTNLIKLDVSFDNMKDLPLSAHLQKLLTEISKLEVPFLYETRQQIEDTMAFIHFIELTKAEIHFDPIVWVVSIWPIKNNLIRSLNAPARLLQKPTIFSVGEDAKTIAAGLLTSIESFDDISEMIDAASNDVVQINNMFERISSRKLTTEKLTAFLSFYLSE